jgi:hypothetical protein
MTTGGGRAPQPVLARLRAKTRGGRSHLDWITILLLAPAALFALVVGGHDAVYADDLGIRTIAGGLFIFGGVVAYVVVIRIARGSRAEALEMLACLIVAVVSLAFVATQLVGRHIGLLWPAVQLAVFVAFVIGSLFGARQLWQSQRRRGRSFKLGQFKVLGSAVSLGAVLGLLQFWYTNIYIPGSAEPSLTITPSITSVQLRPTPAGSRVLVDARVDFDNTSGGRLEIVAAEYFSYGTCVYAQSDHSAEQQAEKALRGGAAATLQAEQYRDLVGFGTLSGQGDLINAGETDHQFIVGILKPGYYDMASIALYVVLARPTLHLDAPTKVASLTRTTAASAPAPGPPCAHLSPDAATGAASAQVSVTYRREINDDSWIHWLSRGRQYLRIHYSTTPGLESIALNVSPHQASDSSSAYNNAMSRLYGVTDDVAHAGTVLPAAGAQRSARSASSLEPGK